MDAARKLPTQAAGKVGWQAERFWETKDQIYGGISWTTDVITQIWYPSTGYLSRKGTLTGAYMYGAAGRRSSTPGRSPSGCRSPRSRASKLHPGYCDVRRARRGHRLEQHGVRAHGLGRRGRSGVRRERARCWPQPQGRFHMAGDQVTWWSGWQEGAILSAWEAVKSIDRHDESALNWVVCRIIKNSVGENRPCSSPSRSNATTGTFRSSTAP